MMMMIIVIGADAWILNRDEDELLVGNLIDSMRFHRYRLLLVQAKLNFIRSNQNRALKLNILIEILYPVTD